MFYTELVRQATDIAGVTDVYSDGADPTASGKAFGVLRTSLLALNSDDRLTFAVDDLSLRLDRPKLVLLPGKEPDAESGEEEQAEIAHDEQPLYIGYPVEIPPSYVLAFKRVKMRMLQYENFIADIWDLYSYAVRIEHGRATLHFRWQGDIQMGIRKPLGIPESITDEVRMTGSALNLVKYKLATELCALHGLDVPPAAEQKYAEYMQRHSKIKTDILAPPALSRGLGGMRADIYDGGFL
jgi:hypothetical protein